MKTLKQIRKEKRIKLMDVCNDLGMHADTIRRIEAGDKVSYEKMCDYAHYLGVELVPLQLGKSYMTTIDTNEGGTVRITADYGRGNVVEVHILDKTIVRYEMGLEGRLIPKETYDYDKWANPVRLQMFLESFLTIE